MAKGRPTGVCQKGDTLVLRKAVGIDHYTYFSTVQAFPCLLLVQFFILPHSVGGAVYHHTYIQDTLHIYSTTLHAPYNRKSSFNVQCISNRGLIS